MQIIGEPFKYPIPRKKNGRPILTWIIPTDEGELTAAEVGKPIGMSGCAIINRIRRYGWQDPAILKSREEFMREREERARDPYDTPDIPDCDIGKFSHLSGEDRFHNIFKIKPPGTWERRKANARKGL